MHKLERQRAESQWIMAARPLCHLQYPIAYLSRLQRILPTARWKWYFKAAAATVPPRRLSQRHVLLGAEARTAAHVLYWWVNDPTLGEFCFTMIGKAKIEESKSNVAMNAWLPQASYPCGNFSDTSSFEFRRRIPLVRTSSELAIRRVGKAPEGTVPSPSPGRHAVTRSRRGSSSSSLPIADGFGTGTAMPSPQSQSFSRSYGSILPTSLAYIVPSTRGCSPWRPDTVISTTGHGRHSVLRIFKGLREHTGHHAMCGALPAARPYLRLSRFQDGSNGEPTGQRPECADAEARRRRALPSKIEKTAFHERIESPGFVLPPIHAVLRPESIGGLARRRSTSERGASPAPIRFPPNNFKHSLTLFSKSFSSFPRGTCSLSISRPYLELDEIHCPIWATFPNNPTRRQHLRVRQGSSTTGISPSPAPPSRGLGPGPPLRTLLQTIIRTTEQPDSKAGLFPVRSPLLRESFAMVPEASNHWLYPIELACELELS
ncbi:Protein TAR1 [Capsicum baccatum]|uniref:Protein TAR1 n=1 Tax=Capsicum baccatum TaxID=33114 RepID=A0A2G2XHG9_CAPBA|nr:Protein TAR1 [Capsicum baccatum]